MRIIRDKEELEGTCYIEVLPGKYLETCWNEHSIFLDEEVFGYLEKAIYEIYPKYDHYAFTEIHRDTWMLILEKLNELVVLLDEKVTMDVLKEHVYFIFGSSEAEFQQDFDHNVRKLRELIIEFETWMKEHLKTEEYISVLGI